MMNIRPWWLGAATLLGAAVVSVGLLRSGGAPRESTSRTSRVAGRRGAAVHPEERSATPEAAAEVERPGFLERVLAPLNAPAHVTGVVVDGSGNPVDGATVWAASDDPDGMTVCDPPSSTTNADGAFDMPLPKGTRLVRVSARGLPPALATAQRRRVGPPRWGRFDVGTLVLQERPHVDGRVVDRDGNGIAGATVSCWHVSPIEDGDFERAAQTAEDGGFSLAARELGETVTLFAAHERFAPRVVEDVRVGADPIAIVMSAGGVVRGTVRDDRGAPLSGVRIETDAVRTSDPMRPWIASVRAATGDDGTFELRGLPLGARHVWPEAFGWSSEIREIDLSESGEAIADFSLHGLERIPGVVVDATSGAPIAGVNVTDAEAPTDDAGRFVLACPGRPNLSDAERRFLVVASKSGWVDERAAAGPGDREVRIEMRRAGTLCGVVVDEEGRPLEGAVVTPFGRDPIYFTKTKTADDGAFWFDRVPPGSYEYLEIEHRGHPSRRLPGFELRAGEAKQWTIVLGLGRGVAGRVLDRETGRPIPLADVTVWRFENKWFPDCVRTTDRDGVFRMSGIAGGATQLVARAPGYAPLVQPVDLPADPNDAADATLLLEPGLALEGVVVGPDGEPRAGARIRAECEVDDALRPLVGISLVRADDAGRFRLDELLPAPVRVTATAVRIVDDRWLATGPITISPPFEPVRLVLEPNR
jgi:carboxypeptidase family protein